MFITGRLVGAHLVGVYVCLRWSYIYNRYNPAYRMLSKETSHRLGRLHIVSSGWPKKQNTKKLWSLNHFKDGTLALSKVNISP